MPLLRHTLHAVLPYALPCIVFALPCTIQLRLLTMYVYPYNAWPCLVTPYLALHCLTFASPYLACRATLCIVLHRLCFAMHVYACSPYTSVIIMLGPASLHNALLCFVLTLLRHTLHAVPHYALPCIAFALSCVAFVTLLWLAPCTMLCHALPCHDLRAMT